MIVDEPSKLSKYVPVEKPLTSIIVLFWFEIFFSKTTLPSKSLICKKSKLSIFEIEITFFAGLGYILSLILLSF